MAFLRLDEDSGNQVIDSVIPIRDGEIQGQDANSSRAIGYSRNALQLDGGDDWINLDPFNSGYLGDSFEGRTFMAWVKINPKLYSGPAITQYKSLAAHFPFDLGFGKTVYDSNFDQLEGSLVGDPQWSENGKHDSSLVFVNPADHLRIPANNSLSSLHHNSYTISLWVNPNEVGESNNQGKLHAFSFDLEKSDYYLENIENLLALTPNRTSVLKDEETLDLNTFSPLDIPGLLIWMDASDEDSFDINTSTETIIEWRNKVTGQGYDFDEVWGNPTRKSSTGKWTVNFDGDDMIGTGDSFGGKNYSIFAILQTGGITKG